MKIIFICSNCRFKFLASLKEFRSLKNCKLCGIKVNMGDSLKIRRYV